MLPGKDGFEICEEIRKAKEIPILMVTAKTEDIYKICGLRTGVDDYIVKPFNPNELIARVESHLSRYERLTTMDKKDRITEKGSIKFGRIKILPEARRVYVDDEEIKFANKEFELLMFLVSNPNIVFSKDKLLSKNRCETLADIFRDSVKFEKEWLDAIVKILNSDYKDLLEAGDLICLSRGSLYYISWIEENGNINTNKYNEKEKRYYIEIMEWLGYLFQSWYEDFDITGKDITEKLSIEDYRWLAENWVILHTQDTKYVLEEIKKTRNLDF